MKREDLRNRFRTGSERKRKSRHVSQTDPAPTAPHNDIAFAAAEASLNQSKKGFGNLVERITPWLAEMGNWVFAGLIAFILIIMASLITVGPVDSAITVATVAMAVISLGIVVAALITLRSPESPEQKERNRRYWEEMMQRAKEQSTTNNERASPEQRD